MKQIGLVIAVLHRNYSHPIKKTFEIYISNVLENWYSSATKAFIYK